MVTLDDIKLPPHHADAEKGVLSWVLLDNQIMYVYESVGLESADFYTKAHAAVFAAMMTLWWERTMIDAVTLSDQLGKDATLDDIGWVDYLYEINAYLLTTSQCPTYAQIVKDKSTLRNILRTSQWIIGDVYEQKDTIEILEAIEKRIFDLTQINVWKGITHIKDILNSRVEEYMEIADNPELADVGKTFSGYGQLDKTLSGFQAWQLIVLAARPAMGKTSFALNLVLNAAIKQKKTVWFFSLEMTSDQLVDRLLAGLAAIPMSKITKGQLDDADFANIGESIEKLWGAQIYLDDNGWLNVAQLRSKLRRLKVEKGNLDLVVIDYLQLMSGAGSKFAGNRVMEISEISRSLKELAKELMIPIIALSQLSRAVESRIDKEPQLSDLRDSGAIEQDADTVMMLYREEYYDAETDRKGATDIFVRKNRNGPVEDVELYFDAPTMRFIELKTD